MNRVEKVIKEWIEKNYEQVRSASPQHYRILFAISCVESPAIGTGIPGTSKLSIEHHNYLGIKATEKQPKADSIGHRHFNVTDDWTCWHAGNYLLTSSRHYVHVRKKMKECKDKGLGRFETDCEIIRAFNSGRIKYCTTKPEDWIAQVLEKYAIVSKIIDEKEKGKC